MGSKLQSAKTLFRYGLLIVFILGLRPTDTLSLEDDNRCKLKTLPLSEYIRFNRVEGLYCGAGIGLEKMIGESVFSRVQVSGGYATSAKKERYKLSVDFAYVFSVKHIAVIRASFYNKIETLGFQRMGIGANSITALLFKEDYLDYYDRKGIRISFIEKYRNWRLAVGGSSEKDDILSTATQKSWSWFEDDFRSNPQIDEGELTSIYFNLGYNGIEIPGVYPHGHRHAIDVTFADDHHLGGNFTFSRIHLQNSFFLRGFWSQLLAIHADFGTCHDTSPKQYAFYLGGPGSLRGRRVNSYHGNHYWLVRFDHYLPYRPLSCLRFNNPFFYALRPILFADVGSAWTSSDVRSTPDEKTHTDIGIAIGDTDNFFRLDCAWPVDRKQPQPRVTIQLNYEW